MDGQTLDQLTARAEAALGRGDLDAAERPRIGRHDGACCSVVRFHQGTLALQRGQPVGGATTKGGKTAPGAAAVHGISHCRSAGRGSEAAEVAAMRGITRPRRCRRVIHRDRWGGDETDRRCRRTPSLYARHAARLEPSNPARQGELGFVLWRSGQHEEAEAVLRDLLDNGKAGPTDRLNLGNVLAALGRTEEANALYQASAADPRTEADAYHNLALAGEAKCPGGRRRLRPPRPAAAWQAAGGRPRAGVGHPAVRPASRLAARHGLTMQAVCLAGRREPLPGTLSDMGREYGAVLDGLSPEKRDAISFS